MPPGADILRETGRLLSEMANAPAVIVRSRAEQRTLVKVRFIPTRVGEVLSVVVLSDGTVENRFIAVERPLLESELERLHNMLEEVTAGARGQRSGVLAQSLNEHRDELAALEAGFSYDSGERLRALHTRS